MILPEERNRLIVGYKQVCKAISAGKCTKVFLADDCSPSISDNIRAYESSTNIISVSSMRELGDMCEIDVPASCAAIKSL